MAAPYPIIVAAVIGAAAGYFIADRYALQTQGGSLYRVDRMTGDVARVIDNELVPVHNRSVPTPVAPFNFTDDATLAQLGLEVTPENKTRKIIFKTRARFRENRFSYIVTASVSLPDAETPSAAVMSAEDILTLFRKKNGAGVVLLDDLGLIVREISLTPGLMIRTVDSSGKLFQMEASGSIEMTFAQASDIKKSTVTWSGEKVPK